jgi:N-acetylglucosamine kinase-like BadF-type ATPase
MVGRPEGTVVGANAAANLDAAIAPLLGLAGADRWVVTVGLAGISRARRRERVLGKLRALGDVVVTSDAEVALWGALPHGEGVAVIAGTGSIALAREAASGRQARAGGYGSLLGDDGSAFWIGRQALRAALAAREGRGPATRLADLLQPEHPRTVQRLATLAPRVSQAAAEGDPVARDILAGAGQALAELAMAAARNFWTDEPVMVATCGGVWQAGKLVLGPFKKALSKGLPRASVVEPALKPVAGALLMACRRAAQSKPGEPDAERVAKIAAG